MPGDKQPQCAKSWKSAHIHSACFPNCETVAQTTSARADMTRDILAATGANPMPADGTFVTAHRLGKGSAQRGIEARP